MKQDLLELDFGESEKKIIKIRQSECTVENKGQKKEDLKKQTRGTTTTRTSD